MCPTTGTTKFPQAGLFLKIAPKHPHTSTIKSYVNHISLRGQMDVGPQKSVAGDQVGTGALGLLILYFLRFKKVGTLHQNLR